jgi:hypothetical protein
MSKFELSLSTDYVPSWGIYEGVREIIQNALDSQEDGFPMRIIPPTDTNPTLTVLNDGACLDRSVWLMGVTSKGSGDRRGCHGEGLKVGALALARAGRRISLVNGSEGWRVSLEFSRVFSDRQVLTVYTRKLAADSGGFGAKIQLSPGEWAEYKRAFLDLDPSISRLATKETELLLDEDQRGRLYVKGILVEERSGLAFGYNFLSVSTDRDRRMIGSFDFDWYISRCWIEALEQGGVGPDEMLEFLHGDTADARASTPFTFPSQPTRPSPAPGMRPMAMASSRFKSKPSSTKLSTSAGSAALPPARSTPSSRAMSPSRSTCSSNPAGPACCGSTAAMTSATKS